MAVQEQGRVESFLRRLDALEGRLIGDQGLREGQPPLMPAIKSLNDKLKAMSAQAPAAVAEEDQEGRRKVEGGTDSQAAGLVSEVWKRIGELEQLLSVERSSAMQLSEGSKGELVIGQASRLAPLCARLEAARGAREFLNTSEFRGLDGHERSLSAAARAQAAQEQEVRDLARQTRGLLDTYYKFVQEVSRRFVACDEQLARLEQKQC